MGQSHGIPGSCCSGSCLLCLKAGNYLTVLGGCGCCILWPSPPQVSRPALPCRLPQWRGAFILVPARIHRGCVSALGRLLGKVPSRSHAVHPPYTHFGLAKAQEQLLIQGEPPEVCATYLEAKQRSQRRSRPSPSHWSPSIKHPWPPLPPSGQKGSGGLISSLRRCFPATKLPRRCPRASRSSQTHLAMGQPPDIPPPRSHPTGKKPRRAGGV